MRLRSKIMSSPKLEEVFKISGIPTHTFVEPVEYNKIIVSLRTLGRGMVIEGPSGIGKTCAVEKALAEIGISGTPMKLSARKIKDIEKIDEIIGNRNLGTVLIDDFHKLPPELKERIADELKTLADEEAEDTKIVIVGINRAGDTLIKFAPDLVNRIDIIRFEINPSEKIKELIEKGEEALNIEIKSKNEIVTESNGSFYLAQMLAFETCINDVMERCDNKQTVSVSLEVIKQKVYERQSLAFKEIIKQFATGPRLRREGRAPYFHILYWLANSDSWYISIDEEIRKHPEYRGSVGQILEKGYQKDFIEKNSELFSRVINFESSTNIITIEDPQFIFFLRNIIWKKFAELLGYKNISFESKYDFALSFAGTDREIAKKIYNGLIENEIEVFYDKQEQHRILAQDIEDYLGPIYRSEAEYVVCLLSPDYPKRIWAKFESDQFEERFGTNSVIPIIFTNSPLGMFDKVSKIGSLKFDPSNDINAQINNIVTLLKKKLAD